MEKRSVRELGGEVWAEITQLQNAEGGDSLLKEVDFKATQELCELVMGVLARYEGITIVNDGDLPVRPIAKIENDSVTRCYHKKK